MEAGQTVGGARPLRIGEVLDAAIKLYRRKATDLWKIVALIIPNIAPNLVPPRPLPQRKVGG